MPWEKKFDDGEVLDKAMHAFWQHGYEATSIKDLINCMGINRGSIYASFKDKRNLFLLAFEHYEKNYRGAMLEEFRQYPSARAGIISLFEEAVETAVSDEQRLGCMLVNTAAEMGPHDEEIADAVSEGYAARRRFFEELLQRGKAEGEIPQHVDEVETAKALLGLLTSVRVLARGKPEQDVLHTLVRQVRRLIS